MATRGVKGGGGSEVQLSHKSATVRFIMLAIMDMIMLAIMDMIMLAIMKMKILQIMAIRPSALGMSGL